MEKRVKAFFDEGVAGLERKINQFLTQTEGRLVDIKYDAIINVKDWGPSALLVYIPAEFIKKEEEKNEKEKQSPKKSKKGNARVQGRRATQRKQERSSSEESGASSSDRPVGGKKSRCKNTKEGK